jgi:D-alanine-D-alanine ligase
VHDYKTKNEKFAFLSLPLGGGLEAATNYKHMKKNIAVVYGGDSSEFVVSVKSSINVYQAIDPEKYNVWKVQMKGLDWDVMENEQVIGSVDKDDFSFILNGQKIKFDFAYITIHGTPGEDGKLQGYFDLVKVPYSTCGVYSSALTFNKYFCSNYLRNFGIAMAKSVRVFKGEHVNVDASRRSCGVPPSPNSDSNTSRGCASEGSGVVGDDQERLF